MVEGVVGMAVGSICSRLFTLGRNYLCACKPFRERMNRNCFVIRIDG